MEKIKVFFKGLSNLFKNMSDIVEYSDTQKKNEKAMAAMNESLKKMTAALEAMGKQLNTVVENQTKMEEDLEKVKSGL